MGGEQKPHRLHDIVIMQENYAWQIYKIPGVGAVKSTKSAPLS